MSSAAAPVASLSVKASPRPGSRMALEVAIPAGRSQASYDAAVEKLSRSIKLPGFRKGKVPRPVLLQQIGPLRIRATALEDLVEAACRDALEQEPLAALGRPELSEGFEAVLARFEPKDLGSRVPDGELIFPRKVVTVDMTGVHPRPLSPPHFPPSWQGRPTARPCQAHQVRCGREGHWCNVCGPRGRLLRLSPR